MEAVRIRRSRDDDAPALAGIFFESVRVGAAARYDDAQRRAWAPALPEPASWRARLSPQTVFVADDEDGPVGFMTLRPDGCIDLAYVRPAVMGTGVAGALYDAVLAEAVRLGFSALSVEASPAVLRAARVVSCHDADGVSQRRRTGQCPDGKTAALILPWWRLLPRRHETVTALWSFTTKVWRAF